MTLTLKTVKHRSGLDALVSFVTRHPMQRVSTTRPGKTRLRVQQVPALFGVALPAIASCVLGF